MYNARIGFIDGLKKTTNGGINWNPIAGGEPSLFFDMHFVDSLTGWKCHQQMRKTTDGGLTWVNQTLPTGGNIIFNYILKFNNVNKDTIWGVGGVISTPTGLRGMLFRTINGGDTWKFQIPDTAIHSGQFQHIHFVNRNNGWAYWSASGIHTTVGGDTTFYTAVKQINSNVPNEFRLYQNYPNPFNPKTIIKYQLIRSGNVKLIVFDVTGRQMIDLVNKKQNAGTYEVDFSGIGYASGVFFYSLIVDGRVIDTRKMLIIK